MRPRIECRAEGLGKPGQIDAILRAMRQLLRSATDRELPIDVHAVEAAGMAIEEQRHARIDQALAAGLGQRCIGEPTRTPATDRNQRAQVRMRLLEFGQCGEILRRFRTDRAPPVLDGRERVEQVGEALGGMLDTG